MEFGGPLLYDLQLGDVEFGGTLLYDLQLGDVEFGGTLLYDLQLGDVEFGGALLYDLQHQFLWQMGERCCLCDTVHVLGNKGHTSCLDILWNEREVQYQHDLS